MSPLFIFTSCMLALLIIYCFLFFVQLSFDNWLVNITVKVTKIHIFIIIHVDSRSLHDELHTEFNLVSDRSDGSFNVRYASYHEKSL